MQVVILAAGKGTRMEELTKDTPKSMLVVAGKSILERKLEMLPEAIDEVVIITGYLSETIKKTFGDSYKGTRIVYAEQENPVGGTMDALRAARPVLHDTFLVMNGDQIDTTEDAKRCMRYPWALAVSETDELGSASLVKTSGGTITDIVEADSHKGGKGLAGVGMYVLDTRIFDVEPARLPGRTETGLPQTMLAASRKLDIPLTAVPVELPRHFTTPEDIARGGALLRKK